MLGKNIKPILLVFLLIGCLSAFDIQSTHQNLRALAQTSRRMLEGDAGSCYALLQSGSAYNLNALRRSGENETDFFSAFVTDNASTTTIQFGVCSYVHGACANASKQTYATETSSDVCSTLTGDDGFTAQTFQQIDLNHPEAGIRIDYNTEKNAEKAFRINLKCQADAEEDLVQISSEMITEENSTVQIYVVNATSKAACPAFSIAMISKFMKDHKYIFAGVLGSVGVFLAFLGMKLYKPTIFIIGCLLTTVIGSLVLFTVFVKQDSPTWYAYAIMGVTFILGLIVGYLCTLMESTGVFMIGGWLGSIIGIIVFDVFLIHIDAQGYDAFVFPATIMICSVGIGSLGVWFKRHIIIIGTSLCGSYVAVRAVSLIFGGWPDEYELYEIVKSGNYSQIQSNVLFWAYTGTALLMCIVSAIVQYKYNPAEEDKEKDSKKHKLKTSSYIEM